MARSLDDIIGHADELTALIESDAYEFEMKDAAALRELFAAAEDRSLAEARIADAVRDARHDEIPWSLIGLALGTSGEAARQRYGTRV